jgi:hypothetical protein
MAGDQLADAAHERSRRRLISTSWFLVCSSLRAVNSARTSCAGNDLQCTGRNQPSRISWAMLRASLRSVLTGIPLPAKASALVARSPCRPADARARRAPLHRILRSDDPQQEHPHGLTGPRATSLSASSSPGYSRLMGADEEGGGLHAREVVASAHPL